jgi:sulfoxide reductase heme-binding subunit YedZ
MVGLTAIKLVQASAITTHVALASAPSPTLWYVTRAAGVAAYIALSLSVALGMLRTIARNARERLSWVVDELHQFVATLAGVLLLGHLVALALDPFLPFSITNLLLPVAEPYRPLAVNLGVFSLYCMVVLLLSSWIRRRLPYKMWRGLHYVSFVLFVLVTAHGWLAGSDSGEPWMRAVYGFATAAVGFMTLARLLVGQSSPAPAAAPVEKQPARMR